MSRVFTQYCMRVGSTLIYHNQTIGIEAPDGNADVNTVPGGAEGVAPGPDITQITCANAVPQAGADYDWWKAKRNRTPLKITVFQMGSTKKLDGTFIVRTVGSQSGVGEAVTDNVMMQSVGSPAPIFE